MANPKKKIGKARTIKGQVVFTPEMVANALDVHPTYSNNFQMQTSGIDVWLFFNEVMPNGKDFSIHRRANIVVSVPQFFAVLKILNEQAQLMQEQMKAAVVVGQQRLLAESVTSSGKK